MLSAFYFTFSKISNLNENTTGLSIISLTTDPLAPAAVRNTIAVLVIIDAIANKFT